MTAMYIAIMIIAKAVDPTVFTIQFAPVFIALLSASMAMDIGIFRRLFHNNKRLDKIIELLKAAAEQEAFDKEYDG